MTVRVYSPHDTPRLRYVLGFLSEYFGRPFVPVPDADGADIAYTRNGRARLSLEPAGLLEERGIYRDEVPLAQTEAGDWVLFPDDSAFGFDLFSALFYLLARCEEYMGGQPDAYGRFAHTASVAWHCGFLQRPLVHEWLDAFSTQLFGEGYVPPCRFLPTIDVDMAWSYRHKGFLRNVGGLLRSLISNDGKGSERMQVLRGTKKDPFDAFAFLEEVHGRAGTHPYFFIHAGAARNRYDKSIPVTHRAMRALVQELSRSSTVGLHPSWASGDKPALVASEKAALEAALGTAVHGSRQHFIRMTLPHTYRQLLSAGITDDYSMGYGSINGFRASVAVPFYWYDLERDEQTALRLHPFAFMDANALFEQKQDAAQTEGELAYYFDMFRKWGGTFISVWHNSYLGTAPEYGGWPQLYERFLQKGSALSTSPY